MDRSISLRLENSGLDGSGGDEFVRTRGEGNPLLPLGKHDYSRERNRIEGERSGRGRARQGQERGLRRGVLDTYHPPVLSVDGILQRGR